MEGAHHLGNPSSSRIRGRHEVIRALPTTRPALQKHDRVLVVREDLLEGGGKMRFLPIIAQGAAEVVFGGPCCGGAPWALSVYGREAGVRITLFYAKRQRDKWHARQIKAEANGASIREVPFGRIGVVQKRARDYAVEAGALFLPLGFDTAASEDPFVAVMEGVRKRTGSPDQIWCATGSGMAARCLGRAFPDSEICGVAVGLASRHSAQTLPPNVRIVETPYKFEQVAKETSPFPACGHYERKAWTKCVEEGSGKRMFWNIAGD